MAIIKPMVKKSPTNSLEVQIASIIEQYKENIPIDNDRNRLIFSLFNFMNGTGDPPEISVDSTKIKIEGLTKNQLAAKLSEDLKAIKK
jgi:hypothetical protein